MSYNVEPLFAVPFYTSKLENNSNSLDEIKTWSYERVTSNNGDISTDKYVLESPKLLELKTQILDHINVYAREVLSVKETIEFYITNSWIMRHKKGDWSHLHNHNNSLISGVVYISTDNDSGNFRMHKKHVNTFPSTITPEINNWNIFNSEIISITPQVNDIILFPSILEHDVSPCNSDQERYCIVFNVFIRGNLGDRDNSKISDLTL